MRAVLALLGLLAFPAHAGSVPQPNMQAALVAEAPGVMPGQTVRVGLRLRSDAGWHTYWRNPGDAGSPTEINWTLPEGMQAGPIEWPAPQVIKEGDVVIFGYDGGVLLPATLRAPANARPGDSLAIKAQAYWVVCREICIPGDAELTLDLPVVAAPAPLAAPWPTAPTVRPGWSARFVQDEKSITLTIDTAGETPADMLFLPHAPGLVPPDARQVATQQDKRVVLRLARAPELRRDLDRIDGLLLGIRMVEGQREPLAVVVEATR